MNESPAKNDMKEQTQEKKLSKKKRPYKDSNCKETLDSDADESKAKENAEVQVVGMLHTPIVSKKKKKLVFPYGNYRYYYGYRNKKCNDEDPRLKVMKLEWFEGKECLDIGCNNGVLTISIAQKFQCKSILGVDIDSDRIEDACWHLRKFERENVKKSKQSGLNEANYRNLSEIVSFKRENFVQKTQLSEKRYDTILCLSVTKWVHLNWGDDGLIYLFSKIWKLLNPGGYFVLEPQPWKSYESNRTVSETTAMNFTKIIFRPQSFQEILLDNIGFRYVEEVTSTLDQSQVGFQRPIFVFQK